jgi:AhpD family alkylhydroperoxidase
MSETEREEGVDCVVELMATAAPSGIAVRAFRADLEQHGRVLNATRALVVSPTSWQATSRSHYMFATLRRIDARTRALLCLSTSLINGCAYCIDDAAGDALRLGISREWMLALPDLTPDNDDETLGLMLRYGAQITVDPTTIDGAMVAALQERVDVETFLEVTSVVAMKVYWNRLAMSLRLPPEGNCEDSDLLRALRERHEVLRGRRGPA